MNNLDFSFVQTQIIKFHTRPITCLVVGRDNNRSTYDKEGELVLFSASDNQIVRWTSNNSVDFSIKTYFRGHTEDITCIIYDLPHDTLISGSYDSTVRIWNAKAS